MYSPVIKGRIYEVWPASALTLGYSGVNYTVAKAACESLPGRELATWPTQAEFAAFRDWIAVYDNSALLDNSQYWVGLETNGTAASWKLANGTSLPVRARPAARRGLPPRRRHILRAAPSH